MIQLIQKDAETVMIFKKLLRKGDSLEKTKFTLYHYDEMKHLLVLALQIFKNPDLVGDHFKAEVELQIMKLIDAEEKTKSVDKSLDTSLDDLLELTTATLSS